MATGAIAAFGTELRAFDGVSTYIKVADIKAITGPGLSTDVVDVTNHCSPGGFEEVITTIKRTGEISFDLNFVPTDATHGVASNGLLDFWQNKIKRSWELEFPDTTVWTFDAFVVGFETSASVEEELAASVTLKLTGQPTLT